MDSNNSSNQTLVNYNDHRQSAPSTIYKRDYSRHSVAEDLTQHHTHRLRKSELILHAPRFIQTLFQCDPAPPVSFPNQIALPAFLLNIMNRTKINTSTLTAAFLYLNRLKELHPKCKGTGGSGHRLFLAAIILAAKYLYDDSFDNTAWSTVSSGLFDLEQVNQMEREMLQFVDFKLFIRHTEWNRFSESLAYEMIPKDIGGYSRQGNTERFVHQQIERQQSWTPQIYPTKPPTYNTGFGSSNWLRHEDFQQPLQSNQERTFRPLQL